MSLFGQTSLALAGGEDQFRLVRMQCYNWGTFSNLFTFEVAEDGHLFVGPSGGGKSTLLDINATLMTPKKWLDFNMAARADDSRKDDRNHVSYVRGAWGQQTVSGNETAVQYLRTGTTWSGVSKTYRNSRGRVVVLIQLMWIRGISNAANDLQSRYLILEREFSLEDLGFFPEHDYDVRRFKVDLPDAAIFSEFSAYSERFRHLLGIDSDRALRLLHKTQSAKNLGDVNTFLRSYMLDDPDTFEMANKLVASFVELDAAHKAVVSAREQRDVLKVARETFERHQAASQERDALEHVRKAVDTYAGQVKHRLLSERKTQQDTDLEVLRQSIEGLEEAERLTKEALERLQQRRRDMGGAELENLQQQINAAEQQKPIRLAKRALAKAACEAMDWPLPDDVVAFVQRTEAARHHVDSGAARHDKQEKHKDALKAHLSSVETEFSATRLQVEAMERKRSNIPYQLQDLRDSIVADLNLPDDALPFAGELIEVRGEESRWQGAIERVLGGFARSILVEEAHYAAVSEYMNDTHLNQRIVYHRMLQQSAGNQVPGPKSLTRKLNLKAGPFKEWLLEEVKSAFDYDCVESAKELRAARRAVTITGQVKHNSTRHEKNDRTEVGDRRNWVLGFDVREKLSLFKTRAQELALDIAGTNRQLELAKESDATERDRDMACNTLMNLQWSEVDVGSLLRLIRDLTREFEQASQANPDLARLDESLRVQTESHKKAAKNLEDKRVEIRTLEHESVVCQGLLNGLSVWPTLVLAEHISSALEVRFSASRHELSPETVDLVARGVVTGLGNEMVVLAERRTALKADIETKFAEFNRLWPAESGGLDARLESAPDYFRRLDKLIEDNLPAFEARFFRLLNDQIDQSLAMLSSQLDKERQAIEQRMEAVNASLRDSPFGEGTHLVIHHYRKVIEDVVQFQADVQQVKNNSFSTDRAIAEQRFVAMAKLVKRLGSQETADRNWRALVLDVRRHVEFQVRELDEDGVEKEVYLSGSGKSGGQRQKLTATILAAALRYQLSGAERALPMFSTVMMDEAFDKADAEFTATAMNVFRQFGFQIVAATPMKAVMALEPYIGGAHFVHCEDRKKSLAKPIQYQTDSKQLKLTEEMRRADAEAAES